MATTTTTRTRPTTKPTTTKTTTKTTTTGTRPETSLIGCYFHSINPRGKVEWQGQVIGRPEPGVYLLQLFEWFHGDPNVCRLVKVEDMHGWLFYRDNESLLFAYEHGVARKGGPYRD